VLPLRFAFSASSLQDYADCARRFQLRYVLDIDWPADHDPGAMRWGQQAKGEAFHQLIYRHSLGFPTQVLSAQANQLELGRWWNAYVHFPPPKLDLPVQRSEVGLSMPLGQSRLTARYDLLAFEPGKRALILDWKTNARRPKRSALERYWQTRVYPYLLVEAGDILSGGVRLCPGQVEVVYWFANYPRQPERFAYSADQHKATAAALSALVAEIVARDESPWPPSQDGIQCQYCTYRTLCERERVESPEHGAEAEPDPDLFALDIDLEQIAEIEF
jgi:CRISPR/Cas system-associated exonuclease Cas4 (RecB family)